MRWNPLNWFRRGQFPVVGSRVVTPKGNLGSVRAIVGGEAWVKTGRGQNVVCNVADLRRPID